MDFPARNPEDTIGANHVIRLDSSAAMLDFPAAGTSRDIRHPLLQVGNARPDGPFEEKPVQVEPKVVSLWGWKFEPDFFTSGTEIIDRSDQGIIQAAAFKKGECFQRSAGQSAGAGFRPRGQGIKKDDAVETSFGKIERQVRTGWSGANDGYA